MSRYDWYRIVVFIHVAAVVLTLGPSLAQAVIGARIPKAPIPARLTLTELAQHIGTRIIEPGALVVLASGLIAIPVGSEVFGFEFSDFWVAAGVVLWLAMASIGFLVLRPGGKRMVEIQESLTGPPTEAQLVELDRLGKRNAMFGGIIHVLLVITIFDMVWKPGA